MYNLGPKYWKKTKPKPQNSKENTKHFDLLV